jgi:hypothetical protein
VSQLKSFLEILRNLFFPRLAPIRVPAAQRTPVRRRRAVILSVGLLGLGSFDCFAQGSFGFGKISNERDLLKPQRLVEELPATLATPKVSFERARMLEESFFGSMRYEDLAAKYRNPQPHLRPTFSYASIPWYRPLGSGWSISAENGFSTVLGQDAWRFGLGFIDVFSNSTSHFRAGRGFGFSFLYSLDHGASAFRRRWF